MFHLMTSTLRSALKRKSKVELASKRVADGLTPLTLLAASLGFRLALRRDPSQPLEAWKVVLSVLMSATPCPAAIGVPVAMLSGMSQASHRFGSTIKSGDALEALCDAKCVVFDKTGTLTFGAPVVSRVVCRPESSLAFASQCIASVERLSKHVLADAFVKANAHVTPLPVTEFQEVAGFGVSGVV